MTTVTGGEIPTGDEVTWYLGEAVTLEAVGTGDTIETVYDLDYQAMDYKETIYLDAVLQVRDTDYTVSYTGGTGGVTQITFASPPPADPITATYTKAVEFAASSGVSIDFTHDTMERTVHGSTTKITKAGAGAATAALTDVLVDADILRRFVGTVTADTPATGKTEFSWSGAGPLVVPFVLGRTLRSSAVVLLTYLVNAQITDGTLDFPEDDFSAVEMEWKIDNYKLVYDTPS